MAIKCPKCKTENPDTQKFCGECATPLQPYRDIILTETLETPREELTRGTTLANRYEIIEELGKGGMGRVYRVEDTKLKQEIALKLIKPEIAKDKKTIERFRNELKLARNIRHKNVCGMFDLGETEGAHFITMEYVRGEDLKSFIHRSGQLAVGTSVRIAKQVCEGLSEAHKLRVVHRDLKSNNIMIDKEGNVRIMDFGIARSLEAKGITGAGVMIGTPEYMSPEQAEAKELDHRSDIYSLGVILYEMVTGHLPFVGDTPLSIAMKHKGEIPQNPKELNPQVPDDLNSVIMKCLAKEREPRYQSAEELRSELGKIEKGIPTTGREIPKRKPLTSKEITVTFGLKKLLVPALIFIAIVIIGVVIWQLLLEKDAAPRSPGKPAIAVLPFVDLSPQKNQEYLCDGMTSEIITKLSGLQGWKVMNTASVMRFKNTEKDVKDIGQELDVATILYGSVRKEENDIRIDVQLVNAEDRFQLWSETYEQKLERVFAIQSDVAEKIAQALKMKLTPEEKKQIQKRSTENLEAYNLYLKGRFFWNKKTREGYDKSIEYFQQAIEKDPGYAIAYAGLADSYLSYAFSGYTSRKAVMPKAKAAAMSALEIDNTLSEAHASLAFVKVLNDWDWYGGESGLKQAIKLNPGYATAHYYYSWLLTMLGRHDEAIVEGKRAQELDPLSIAINVSYGRRYYYARLYDKAIEEYRKVLELDPNAKEAHWALGFPYVQKGMYEEAIEEFRKGIEVRRDWSLGYAFGVAGKRDEALEVLNQHLERSKREFVWPATIAFIYIGLGEKEKALDWLEKTYEEREAWLDLLKVEPIYDSLRSDPRFQDLIRRMNYPD
jgi:serine/threonine protein kinase/tetratricopeptide (TPR) repeat protein